MRLVTWNCFRGDCLQRASELSSLTPDVVVLQECGRPAAQLFVSHVWLGSNPRQGVGVVCTPPFTVSELPSAGPDNGSVFPCVVSGPLEFNLLVVWAKPTPTYVDAVWSGVDSCIELLRDTSRPSVVAGDFNSHRRFDKPSQRPHRMLEDRLREQFGLVSAWHAVNGDLEEPPTHYHRWKEENGFHIDYCFIPETWVPHVREVTVAPFSDTPGRSDHSPLLVDLDM